MLKLFKNFLKEEDGLGTVEIVVIIAVLVCVALIFKNVIIQFVKDLLSTIFGTEGDATKMDYNKESDDIIKSTP